MAHTDSLDKDKSMQSNQFDLQCTLPVTDSDITLLQTIPTFSNPEIKGKPFENMVGKGENAGNQHFLHFPHCFQSN